MSAPPKYATVVMPFEDLDALQFPFKPKSEGGQGFVAVGIGDRMALVDSIIEVCDGHRDSSDKITEIENLIADFNESNLRLMKGEKP